MHKREPSRSLSIMCKTSQHRSFLMEIMLGLKKCILLQGPLLLGLSCCGLGIRDRDSSKRECMSLAQNAFNKLPIRLLEGSGRSLVFRCHDTSSPIFEIFLKIARDAVQRAYEVRFPKATLPMDLVI